MKRERTKRFQKTKRYKFRRSIEEYQQALNPGGKDERMDGKYPLDQS
jgi:hypothetical protein